MLYRIALTIMCVALILGIAFGEPNMQDGMLKISVKAEMPGMTMEMPPIKFNQCLIKKDYVPQQKGRNEDCKIVGTRIDGDTVTWVVQCRMKEGTTDSTGKITYKVTASMAL